MPSFATVVTRTLGVAAAASASGVASGAAGASVVVAAAPAEDFGAPEAVDGPTLIVPRVPFVFAPALRRRSRATSCSVRGPA